MSKLSPAMIKAMNELRDTGAFQTTKKTTIDALEARKAFEIIDGVGVATYSGAKAMAEVDPSWAANDREILAAVQAQDEKITPVPAHPIDVFHVVPNRKERRATARKQRINAKRNAV